ncbi:MAG: 30S ribosome-binding factor RbfA [Bacteroidales bacterium]|jgi:ribosome-binding factor A|nr:30S ribosome-binding factor RbfA [Bacteroidales bacterium]HOL98196.1 30S ribosome-binding factor RbfA [Bacteroidales bacterium]HOM36419.1 30S ribosome-binding factor RbfA [Bacteroidales bacterium]HPD23907.1 30S ribosome-binding factor RbfA [Bacteroidales bacterium]HRS99978.1 30S ribosome-binding factor RbfA [Bacteroidales bacterium]
MNNKRQIQIAGQIKEELANIIMIKFNGLVPGRMVTVTNVTVTADLSIAKVWLSIFPSDDANKIVEEINKVKSKIRFELGQALKNNLRKIPELIFYLDDSLDYIEKIDKLLKS